MKLLLTVAVATLALFEMSASGQSKPATTPPAGSKTVKPGTPPAKVPAKGSATTPAEKKTVSKETPGVAPPSGPTEKLKTVYVVPMGIKDKGQFGLDIHPQVMSRLPRTLRKSAQTLLYSS